jgi:hypothetical protein
MEPWILQSRVSNTKVERLHVLSERADDFDGSQSDIG